MTVPFKLPDYPNIIWGMDVSSVQWQKNLSFIPAFRAGFRFVYVKSSQYSRIRDGKYHDLVQRAKDACMTVGAYHYCSHDTDPRKQANFFFQASEGLGQNVGDMPPVLDWEFCTPKVYPNHPAHCVNWLVEAQEEATGLWYPGNDKRQLRGLQRRETAIYTYPNYAQLHQPALAQALDLGTKPLFYASYTIGRTLDGHWPAEAQIPAHPKPKPWSCATMVQIKGNDGYVPGIGRCDVDAFMGTEDMWRKYLGY